MASKDFGRNAGPACPHCGSAAAPGLTEERAAICPSCGLVIDGPGFTTEKSPSQFNAGGPAPKKVISRHAPYLTSFMRGVTDPAVQLDQRKNNMRKRVKELSLMLNLPDSSVDRAIFLAEQLLGPDQAPAGKRADQFFAAVLFFVSKEMGTALTLSDCSFFVQLAVCDVGMWYRWIHGILKELEAESKIKDVIAEPKSLMEKYYPHIRRYVREILESIRNFDGTEHECKEKVDATAAEIVHLTETTGLSTGRNPLAIVAAAVSISLQIHAKSLKTDERKVILPLAKRDAVAARLGAGKDTTRQRDQEIRTQLVKMAAQSPWVLIKVDDKTVIDVWHSIAPVIRLGNADRHRQSNEALRKMREKVETFGTPGDSKDIRLAEHGWTTGIPKAREESREVPNPLQAEPGLVTPASMASIVPLALPTIKSKRKAANPQPEKSAADGIPPAVVSVSGDVQAASSSSHDTQLTTSNSTNNAKGSVDELVLPSPIQVEEKPRVTADDVVKQIYPGSFFPAFKNSMDTRKTRCYQIRQAISRLKDSHLTHTLPFDAWEAALTSISVEIDAPIKAEDEEDEKKDPDVVATPARYKKPIFHHNKLGQKVGKSKKQSAVDVDKKQLSPDDHMIETLLVEGASVLDIVEQGEDLRSLLDHTPAKLARLEMMLNVEEKAPEGELSQVSAFLPEQDPDFQMRTADQQKLVRAFLDSEYVASTQRGYVRKKAKVEPSSPTMLDMDIPGPIDGNYADDYDDIDVEEENRRQQLRAKNLNRPSQSNEDDIEDDQDGPNYI